MSRIPDWFLKAMLGAILGAVVGVLFAYKKGIEGRDFWILLGWSMGLLAVMSVVFDRSRGGGK